MYRYQLCDQRLHKKVVKVMVDQICDRCGQRMEAIEWDVCSNSNRNKNTPGAVCPNCNRKFCYGCGESWD